MLSYKSDYTDLQLDNSLSDEWQKGISQWAELLPNYIEQELQFLQRQPHEPEQKFLPALS